MRRSVVPATTALALVGCLGLTGQPQAATADDAPPPSVAGTLMLTTDTDPSTATPDLVEVGPGGSLTLDFPAQLDTSLASATLTDANEVTHQLEPVRELGRWQVPLPADLPDGTAFINLAMARIGATALPASVPLGLMVRATGLPQATTRVRILAATQYTGAPVTLTPGRSTTISLQSSDPAMAALLNSVTSVTGTFGPQGAGAPFEVRTGRSNLAGGVVNLTLPGNYPASQVPTATPAVLRLDSASSSDPDVAFVAVDVPVRLNPRYRRLVQQATVATLGRSATTAELASGQRSIENTGSRTSFSTGLVRSAEFRRTAFTRFHISALGRRPTSTELATALRRLQQGTTLQTLQTEILAGAEFHRRAGGTTAGYVRALSRTTLGRTPTPSELAQWSRSVTPGGRSAVAGSATTSRSRTPLAKYLVRSDTQLRRLLSPYQSSLLGQPTSAATATRLGRAIRSGTRWETYVAQWVASDTFLRRAG